MKKKKKNSKTVEENEMMRIQFREFNLYQNFKCTDKDYKKTLNSITPFYKQD